LPEALVNFGGNGGQPLPNPVRQQMESFFRSGFGDVRVHLGSQAASIGALAFTHGSNVYFAPGQYNPNTAQGLQLIGHELAHVVQQRSARVHNPFGSGIAVVDDRNLESEAEQLGQRAAAHQPAAKPAAVFNHGPRGRSGVVMRYKHLVEKTAFPETRYSDDESIYVRGPHELFATREVVDAANRKLLAASSMIQLRHAPGETSPNFLKHLGRVYIEVNRVRARQIQQIPASENRTVTLDAPFSTLSDCHVTSQMVMGSVDSQLGTTIEVASLPGRTLKPESGGDPIGNRLANAVIKDVSGGGWESYRKMLREGVTPRGVNENAKIDVGLALTQVNSPYEKGQAEKVGKAAWNFHWAGIILESATDYVILENFALDSLRLVWNDDWRFRMHSKVNAVQSFHAENARGPYAVETTLTIAVQSTAAPPSQMTPGRKKCSLCPALFDTIVQVQEHKKAVHV
jgi:hypothetical protein